MDGESPGTETARNPMRTRLLELITMEYGRRNIAEDDDGYIRLSRDDMTVSIWPMEFIAKLYCCLVDGDGGIVTIPVDEISDYLPILVSSPYIEPSLYLSVGNEYIPNYATYIDTTDLEDPKYILSNIDRICFLADCASQHWNDEISKKKGREMEVDELEYDDPESDEGGPEDTGAS